MHGKQNYNGKQQVTFVCRERKYLYTVYAAVLNGKGSPGDFP